MKSNPFSLKTPFRNGWQMQIIFGEVITEAGKEAYHEYDKQFISPEEMKDYHQNLLSFCEAMGTIPVKGDIIEMDKKGLDKVYERWIVPEDRTVLFFMC